MLERAATVDELQQNGWESAGADPNDGYSAKDVGSGQPTTDEGAEQTHDGGLAKASRCGPESQESKGIRHGTPCNSIQELSGTIGRADQGMAGISETRIVIPTLQRGHRAAGSTMRARVVTNWAAVGSRSERGPTSSSRQRARFLTR